MTGFSKVGDWFFGTPLPPGGVRQNESGAAGAEKFFGLFYVFVQKMLWLLVKVAFARPPPRGGVKVGEWFFESE